MYVCILHVRSASYIIVLCVSDSKVLPVVYVIQHSLRGGARNTARHVITVIVLAFLTLENKASKMQNTTNQLKHGKGHSVCDISTRGVVSIDHTALGYALCCMAISTTPLVPLLHIQHFLPCFN